MASFRKFEMELVPKAPFAFTAHLSRFTIPGTPTPIMYEGSSCWRLIRLAGRMPVRLTFSGEPWEPRILVECWCRNGEEAEAALKAASAMVRADFDYNEFIRKVSEIEPLRRLAERHPGLRPGRALSLYEALVDSVVKQRIALRAALRIQGRLVRALGPSLTVDNVTFWDYPDPEALAETDLENLRSLGLTRAKARTLKEIANAELAGDLPDLGEVEGDPEGAISALTQMWGIGRWTAELAIAMVSRRFSIGPASDLSVLRGLSRILERELDEPEVRGALAPLSEYGGLIMYLASFEWEERKKF